MTPYILILYISGGYDGGPTTAEFSSLEACRNAMSVVEGKFDSVFWDVKTFCVPKDFKE